MYEDQLLRLSRETRFRRSEPLIDPVSDVRNPACGDEISISFRIADGRIHDPEFYAQGCAVSVASTEAMCREIEGLSPAEAADRVDAALAFFAGDADWAREWGVPSLPALGAVRARPMRMACVRLPWEAMRDALAES